MATVAAEPASDGAYAVHRTQAMPKNSLFGTSLEIQDETAASAAVEPQVKEKPVPAEIPTHLKPLLKRQEVLDSRRQDVERQKEAVRQSHKDLKSLESKALTFDPDPKTTRGVSNTSKSKHSHVDKTHQWFSQKDIDHVKDINIGGLGTSGNYNRDKYSRRAPIHSYSQMGDLLKPGMEFTPRQTADRNQNSNFEGRSRLRTNITNNMEVPTSGAATKPTSRSVVPLPPNIRHMFGSKVCDELLSDERKVNATIERHERTRDPPRRGRRERTPDFRTTCTPEYSGLSNATRQNVFPGHTADHKVSTTKTVYSRDVFTDRYPIPDEYRYQRDELSKWAEHNVLRERMKKAWDLKLTPEKK